MRKRDLFHAALAGLALAACADAQNPAGPVTDLDPQFNVGASGAAVYTMTNDPAGNEVLAYSRGRDGSITFLQTYATGGLGTGAGLGNQGGLVISKDGRWLLVVNAGSDDVSAFARGIDGSLSLRGRASSGGSMPVSVTSHGSRVYVVNAGGAGNIAGLSLSSDGDLSLIAGSTQPLSQAGGTGAAQIEFTGNGRQLVVTEKATNRIVVYPVSGSGIAGPGVANPSVGNTPFGFGFDNRGRLIVSNAEGGAAGAGSVSSYLVRADGTLDLLAGQVPDYQAAPCWIVVSRDGRFAYTTNGGSNTTSGYRVGPHGGLDLLDANGVTASNSGTPIDAAITRTDGQFLYVLNASAHAIDAFRVGNDGSLSPIGVVPGLPATANGMAAS